MNRFACDCVFSLFTTLSTAISISSSFMEIGAQSFQYVLQALLMRQKINTRKGIVKHEVFVTKTKTIVQVFDMFYISILQVTLNQCRIKYVTQV